MLFMANKMMMWMMMMMMMMISWFMFMLNAPMKITPKFDNGNLIWLNYQNIVESY